MLCSCCLGANMKDIGEYYQCPRCSDIRPKCTGDKGVAKFKEVCLSKRQPTNWDKLKRVLWAYHYPILMAVMISIFIITLMLLQIQKGGI